VGLAYPVANEQADDADGAPVFVEIDLLVARVVGSHSDAAGRRRRMTDQRAKARRAQDCHGDPSLVYSAIRNWGPSREWPSMSNGYLASGTK
jgi:hypothetical protein